MKYFYVFLCISITHLIKISAEDKVIKPAALRLHELEKSGYDTHTIPRNVIRNTTNEHSPLIVYVNMYIYSFSSISVVNMDYTIDLMLRQRWLDQRLQLIAPKDRPRETISSLRDTLWTPDLFFRNAKEGYLHVTTRPNYLIWLDRNGVVTFSQKLSTKASCHMNLWNFPLDTQVCKINLGSYGYATDELDFRWWINDTHVAEYFPIDNGSYTKAVEIRADLEINEFALISHRAHYCSAEYAKTGNFSCLEVEFRLSRLFGFYLIYAYLPSVLIVIIAWVSFLLDPSSAPARVSIGLLCVLSLITQSAAILTQLPRVSYVKAIDIWLFVCLAFVVSSLLEFAAANSITRHKAYRRNKARKSLTRCGPSISRVKSDGEMSAKNQETSGQKPRFVELTRTPTDSNDLDAFSLSFSELNVKTIKSDTKTWRIEDNISFATRKLDMTFAIGYPILFVIFNCIYWFYFLLAAEQSKKVDANVDRVYTPVV